MRSNQAMELTSLECITRSFMTLAAIPARRIQELSCNPAD